MTCHTPMLGAVWWCRRRPIAAATDRRRATVELGRPQADSGVQPREEEPTMHENRNHRIVDASPAAQPGSFMPRSTAWIRFSLHNAR